MKNRISILFRIEFRTLTALKARHLKLKKAKTTKAQTNLSIVTLEINFQLLSFFMKLNFYRKLIQTEMWWDLSQ